MRWRPGSMVIAALAAVTLAACGLEVIGTFTPRDDAGADARAEDDAGAELPRRDAGRDEEDAAVDAAVDAGPSVFRWNIGGPSYAGSAAMPGPWAAGESGVGPCTGSRYTTQSSIQNTDDDVLFQTELFGDPLSCVVTSLRPGTYRVRLIMAEIFFGAGCAFGDGGTGSRVFDIVLEGTTREAALDLHAVAGCAAGSNADARPIERVFEVVVTDGALDIFMPASVNNAKLSALEVVGPL